MSEATTDIIQHETITLSTGSISHIWRHPGNRPRATVILQHGFCEYTEYYVRSHHGFIRGLTEAGYIVYGLDMWGHGRSPGSRGVTHVGKAVLDHLELREHSKREGLPVVLFGHSLGGLVTAGSATAEPRNIKGVILMAPALPDLLPSPLRITLGLLARTLPKASVPLLKSSMDGLTRNQEEIKTFTSDPMIPQRQIPFLLAATALDTMARVNHGRKHWKAPTLVLHGTADTFTKWQGSNQLVREIASEDKIFFKHEDGRHDLLSDPPCAEQTLKTIMEWLDSRT